MQSLGFLHSFLPFKAVLELFRPFQEFHLSQVVPDVVIPSLFRSSSQDKYQMIIENYVCNCEVFVFKMHSVLKSY